MKKQPLLKTKRLILRPFSLDDGPIVKKLAGAREIADTTLNIPHPYKKGVAEEWIAHHKENFEKNTLATFAITDRETGAVMGAISLHINPRFENAEMGYWIGVPYWNKGYCTEAARKIIEFGFSKLKLNRIFAQYFSRNEASGKVMQKAGMQYEGLHRQHAKNKGKFEDLITYGILKSDLIRK